MAEQVLRILVVDDSPEDREKYRRLLSRSGRSMQIEEVESGDEALRRHQAEPFDCVLLDYRLPGLDGLEVLAEMQSDGDTPLPVVMVTSQGGEAVAVAAMKRGAQDYLVKDGLTAENLCRAVDNVVERMRLQNKVATLQVEIERLKQIAERMG